MLVIDSSVLLKLFVDEDDSAIACRVYRMVLTKKIGFVCPEFLFLELSNILLRKNKVSGKELGQIIKKLIKDGVKPKRLEAGELVVVANEAVKNDLTMYDAVYLYLAKKNNCLLLTADSQLLKIREWCVSLKELKLD